MAGAIQVVFGLLGIGRLMGFIPRTVMIGFVNALAILIFMAQLDHFVGEGLAVYAMVAIGIGIGCQPSATWVSSPAHSPASAYPMCRSTSRCCRSSPPLPLHPAFVGLLESLLTAQLIDDITDTRSNSDRASRGQGIATSPPASSAAWPAAP